MKCTQCEWKNPATVKFCRKCGAPLPGAFSRDLIAFPTSGALISEYTDYDESLSYPQPKRRRIHPLIWIILIGLLLIGGGATWWVINTTQPSHGVTQTLQAYCSALQIPDYHRAYQQWSSSTQMSEADFTYTQQSKARTKGCDIGAISITNSSAQVSMTLFFADGSSALDQITLVQEGGVWKIKSQSLS
ncbi:MAG TPA: zinc ribbon domain-containing protein [Ktedonobacteraceae bacterium]